MCVCVGDCVCVGVCVNMLTEQAEQQVLPRYRYALHFMHLNMCV